MFEVTEVRVFVNDHTNNEVMLGYATITLNDVLVIRDIKIISARDGRVFISFPTRRVGYRCPSCNKKNCLTSRFCNECGDKLNPGEDFPHYVDVVFPTTGTCRNAITDKIMSEYYLVKKEREKEAA